ncbi:MAG: DUF5683 domain-containing protein [Gemmatimonadota bacterium]|jgi:hypothetical protein|nr:DUF5683 domain-containing protein [Gemmatimonadota bacterium]
MSGRLSVPVRILSILLVGGVLSHAASTSVRESDTPVVHGFLVRHLAAQAPEVVPDPGLAAVPADPLEVQTPFSPRGAFLRSLVLPGWGQSYVGAPGRGAVYFALASATGWMAYTAHRQKSDAIAQRDWLRGSGAIGFDDETVLTSARSQQFEDWTALTVFLFLFAGADAYVSAYLSDFDERIGITPDRNGAVQIRATLPLSRSPALSPQPPLPPR